MLDEKLCVRLSPALYKDVQQAARRRHMTPSAVVRLTLQQVLGQSTPATGASASTPDAAWELILARCPPEVQTRVRQTVDGTGLSLGDVLKSLVIAACQPKTAPQPTHERAEVSCDNPISSGAGPRSIPRA